MSTRNDWDGFVRFFAEGLRPAAGTSRAEMIALSAVQGELKERVGASALRADSAQALVDLAVAHPTFTVRKVEADLSLSYGRANKLVGELRIFDVVDPDAYTRRLLAPRVMEVLRGRTGS